MARAVVRLPPEQLERAQAAYRDAVARQAAARPALGLVVLAGAIALAGDRRRGRSRQVRRATSTGCRLHLQHRSAALLGQPRRRSRRMVLEPGGLAQAPRRHAADRLSRHAAGRASAAFCCASSPAANLEQRCVGARASAAASSNSAAPFRRSSSRCCSSSRSGSARCPACWPSPSTPLGALGKLFAEVVENIDMKPVEGATATGANWRADRSASRCCRRCCRTSPPTRCCASRSTCAAPPSWASSAPAASGRTSWRRSANSTTPTSRRSWC